MTRRIELETWYVEATDSYDIDRYALDQHLDNLGMWTPAFEDMIKDDLAFMDAYNANRQHGDNGETLHKWLSVFVSLLALVVGLVGFFAPFALML